MIIAGRSFVPPRPWVVAPHRSTFNGGMPEPGENRRADERSGLADLMSRVAADRDRLAFADLFAHFAPRLKSYLRRQGAADAVAEDLVQDVMLTVWRRAQQFDRSKASLATWIFTIARNRRIDILRRERRPEIDPNDPVLTPDPSVPADIDVEREQGAERLRAAIATLPAAQADLLRLAFFEEQSHSDIAARTRLPLGTVKSRIRLAVQKLRAELEDLQ